MGITRRLPDDQRRRLERLERDNWRAQVATAPVQGAEDASRLDDIEHRLDDLENLEGVGESG
jgi:predicted flap endonuclease-1-like 5' DNA nuclease